VIRLSDFERVVFFTGAGLSVESGIPTYRGPGGLWEEYDYERYACQRAFDADPGRVWDFHEVRREFVGRCAPNGGHAVIARAQEASPADAPSELWRDKPSPTSVRVITQNVDGLHQRAGSRDVVELHGSLWRIRCDGCGRREENLETPIARRRCGCGAWLRPDIVWFEDMLDPAVLQAAAEAIASCDLLVSVGTSGVVYPAADLPRIAAENGAVCVEVNPEPTPVSGLYAHHLRGPATAMLLELAGP